MNNAAGAEVRLFRIGMPLGRLSGLMRSSKSSKPRKRRRAMVKLNGLITCYNQTLWREYSSRLPKRSGIQGEIAGTPFDLSRFFSRLFKLAELPLVKIQIVSDCSGLS